MQRNLKTLYSIVKPHFTQRQQCRSITKPRLKWVKNKSLDKVIERDTAVKAATLLKDAIKRCQNSFITSRTIQDWQKPLGLTYPVLIFLKRYPTYFQKFPHPRYPSLTCFRLTDVALLLDETEQLIYDANELASVETLCQVLMMLKSRKALLPDLYKLRWDLGLPDKFETRLVEKYPDYFRVEKMSDGLSCVNLVKWRDEFAVSALEKSGVTNDHMDIRKGKTNLSFPQSYPRGYGERNKVKAWMGEFQTLHYVSPYEDATNLDPTSDIMEKRIIGLLHEFAGLTIHKKINRNHLRNWREELFLPHRFTRLFNRYPGIFYLSRKCTATTATLREAYYKTSLINPHPLAKLRNKVYHVMKTGILYEDKGVKFLTPQDCLLDIENAEVRDSESDDEEECSEVTYSDMSDDSE